MNPERFLIELNLVWYVGVVALAFVVKAYWQRREPAFLFLSAAILAFLVARVFDAVAKMKSLVELSCRLWPETPNEAPANVRAPARRVTQLSR